MSPKRKAQPPLSAARLRAKILAFFKENPGSIDTPRGVATWISADLRAARKALERLAEAGRLKAHRTSSTVAYSEPEKRSRKPMVRRPKGRG